MISTVTLNPALDKTVYLDTLRVHDANRIRRLEQDAGGKGINASRVLKELGSETVALGFIGGSTGSFIEHVLDREGIPTDFVRVSTPSRTNIAIQEVDGAPPTMLNEPGPEVTPAEMESLIARMKSAAANSYAVIFGGSLCRGCATDIYRALIECVRAEGALAVLDADGPPLTEGLAARPFMIKPNIDEARRLCGEPLESVTDIARAAVNLCGRGIELVVISMGKDGAVAGTTKETWLAVPPQVKVVSTIGSGDSMIAGITHILAANGSLEDALRWGSAAGAATAMTNGAEIGRREDVLNLLDQVRVERITV